MIPISYLFSSVSTLFCFFASWKLYLSYKKNPSENLADFLKAYVLLGVYFALVSLPGILEDPVKVQATYVLSYIPALFIAAFLSRLGLRILGRQAWLNYIPALIYSLIVVVVTLNIVFFAPAQIQVSDGRFYHWEDGSPSWLFIFSGILLGILAGASSFFFFWGGRKSQEKTIRARAFLLGGGTAFLLLAAMVNYLFSAFFQAGSELLLTVLADLVSVLGLILLLVGIYYRIEKEPGL